jgi:N-acetyl-1-D-myo-inositol-2-amino-2-deoxy-alpha-D-glucopyranoside deacetylase
VLTCTWSPGTARGDELAEALRVLGYADARVTESAPGRERFCDAPLDEVVRRVVAEIRDVRPEIVVTHDAYGNVTGHPAHVHAHRVAVLAAEAAGSSTCTPGAGPA